MKASLIRHPHIPSWTKLWSNFRFLAPVVGLCLALVILWFRHGLFLGYAENEITWYRPNQAFLYIWIETIAAGKDLLYFPPGIFDFSINFFFRDYVPPMLRQAFLFFTILLTGSSSVFFLTREALRETMSSRNRDLAALLAALFYVMNPYSMTVIWKRFIYAHFFAFALLPLSLVLYDRGIKTHKYAKYAILTSLSAVGFSFAFTITGFLVTYWILLSGWTFFRLVLSTGPERRSAIVGFTVLLPVWAAFNSWWISPSILGRLDQIQNMLSGTGGLGGFGIETFFSRAGNLMTATIQSLAGGGILYVSRLIYGPTSGYAPDKLWGPIYESPFLVLITFLPLVFLGYSMLSMPRNRDIITFSLLALFGSFWANGANAPTGSVFVFLFKHVDLLQPLRGPFETGGMILAIALSFFFGVGAARLLSFKVSTRIKKVTKLGLVSILLVGSFFIYPLPMWSGAVFVDVFSPPRSPLSIWKYTHIDVPPYYDHANTWLNEDRSEFRILHLPLSYTGGAEYYWPHPYQGGDPSDTLFDKPSIAVAAAYGGPMDNMITNLLDFMGSSPNLWKVLSLFNVKYILLHADANTTAIRSPPIDYFGRVLNTVQVPTDYQLVHVPPADALMAPSLKPAWGDVSISIREDETLTRTLVLEGTSNEHGGFGSWMAFDEPRDWRNSQQILISLKTSVKGNLIVQIWDSAGNGLAWYRPLSLSFETITLPITIPDDSFLQPDDRFMYDRISRVLIGVTNQIPGQWVRLEVNTTAVSFAPIVKGGDLLNSGRWSPIWANNFTLERQVDSLGMVTIVVKGTPTASVGFGLWYDFLGDDDRSNSNFFSFQVKSNITGPILVQIWDRSGNAFFWDGRGNPDFRIKREGAWQNFTINLNFPMQVPFGKRLDLRSLDHLFIAWVGEGNSPQELSVRNAMTSEGVAKKTEGIDFVATFGKLALYRVSQEYFLPIIFSQTNFTVSDDYEGLFNLLRGSFDPRSSIVFVKSQVDTASLEELGANLNSDFSPRIDFMKLNPAEYVVHVIDARSPFLLVFSSEFSQNWDAFIEGERLRQEDHFVVNGYANAWYVEKSGSYDVVLKYRGQTLFWQGTIFSIASVGTCLSYSIVRSVKGKKVKFL